MLNKKLSRFVFWAFLVGLCLLAKTVSAQPTAVSYQGKLSDGGSAANGSYQFQFKLFDALAGGNQVGATVDNLTLTVTQGIFSAKLDFGADVFTGANRFLEIAVRRNPGESYVTLSPREQIASSPYSIRTISAAQADLALDSLKLGGIDASEFVTNANLGASVIRNQTTQQPSSNFNISGDGLIGGRVGIGTTAPNFKLTVNPGLNNYGIAHTDGTATVASFVGFTGIGGPLGGWLGTQTNHPLFFFSNSGSPKMTLDTVGRFGIGTINPSARLTVAGSGQFNAAGAARFDLFNTAAASGFLQNVTDGGLWQIATTAGETRMVINSDGNVGIGTISPNAKLSVGGNVTQELGAFGLPKAMILVDQNAGIIRCYNGITNSSTGDCGFTVTPRVVGQYKIDFGFQVNNRFFSLACRFLANDRSVTISTVDDGLQGNGLTPNSIYVLTRNPKDGVLINTTFYVIVY